MRSSSVKDARLQVEVEVVKIGGGLTGRWVLVTGRMDDK